MYSYNKDMVKNYIKKYERKGHNYNDIASFHDLMIEKR